MDKMNEIKQVLISENDLQKRVRDLAVQISKDYRGKEVLLVPVLTGSMVFVSDLLRAIKVPCSVECISVKSYVGKKSNGKPKIRLDINGDLSGKHVVIVDDIIDTGNTLSFVYGHILSLNPESIKTCVLLDKNEARKKEVKVDYHGFLIPEKFVIGYGLDYNGKYRNLSYIGVMD